MGSLAIEIEKNSQRAAAVDDQPEREGFKETIESIVVALILAFVFRAFIVEAFKIPTGSMAPTLNGAHGTVVCADCGWEFAYGLRDTGESQRGGNVTPDSRVICPNCNHVNSNLAVSDTARNAEAGDRILVLKWPYDLGGDFFGPKRWDVAVFKNPSDGAQNYIKRLAGLPGEVLMIVDGDVYRVPTAELSQRALSELDSLRRDKYLLHSGKTHGRLRKVSMPTLRELDEKLRIAKKTPSAQESLWFNVYHHDYMPRMPDDHQPQWKPERNTNSAWDTRTRRITFSGEQSAAEYIELSGKPILASYAYNVGPQPGAEPPPPVSDMRVRFVLTPRRLEGILRIRLVKAERTFWAELQMDGLIRLVESKEIPSPDTPPMMERRLSPFASGRSVKVRFENVDYRLALHIGGQEMLASSSEPGSPAYYAPDVRALRTAVLRSVPPRIYAERALVELTHVAVERDIYYIKTGSAAPHWSDGGGWGTVGNPILLRAGEYFMLGDNSPASQDSRLWGDVQANKYLVSRGEAFQLGTVPADQMIGKAFFVYWPSALRVPGVPMPRGWGIIPNVGRMRWIH
jgi:signal peptidase I